MFQKELVLLQDEWADISLRVGWYLTYPNLWEHSYAASHLFPFLTVFSHAFGATIFGTLGHSSGASTLLVWLFMSEGERP